MKLLEIVLLLYVLTENLELTDTVPGNLQKHQEEEKRHEYRRETASQSEKNTQKPRMKRYIKLNTLST